MRGTGADDYVVSHTDRPNTYLTFGTTSLYRIPLLLPLTKYICVGFYTTVNETGNKH
jgi:hypothetical protein